MKDYRTYLVMVCLFASGACAQTEGGDTIEVTGQAYVDVEPDLAVITTSISHLSNSLAQSKAAVDKVYTEALTRLEARGIAATDIKGEGLQAFPEYVWEDQRRIKKGERVTRRLIVTVRDLSVYAEVVSDLLEAGISNIENTAAGFAQPNEGRQQALGKAADNALENARFLAERLGRSLGQAKRIVDQSVVSQPAPYPRVAMMRAEAAGSDMAPPETFGTERINATVYIQFALQ